MTAWPAARRSGMLAAVATRAERWLLEPPPSHPRATEPEICRPALAVIGLAPRCGTTTLARALAVELAKRDPGGAAIVTSSTRPPAGALASTAARRLARSLTASAPAALGRLCAVDADDRSLPDLAASRPAPLVLEVAHGAAPELAVALADTAALVAGPAVEPALADLVAASLTRDDRPPLIVLNRVPEPADWGARHALVVGDVRLGARFALAGREPTPSLAAPIAELADLLVPGEPG